MTRDDIIKVLGKVNPCTGFMYSDKSSQTTNVYGVERLFMTLYGSMTILRVEPPVFDASPSTRRSVRVMAIVRCRLGIAGGSSVGDMLPGRLPAEQPDQCL